MSDSRPIGIFDSGLGGLTVVKEIIKALPNEDIVYLGDTARVPYGTRSEEVVKRFSLQDAHFLQKKNVKIIVIACNTASSYAGDHLKEKLNIPVFEVISGASKKAVSVTRNKKIGIIGTRGTIGSKSYEKAIRKLDSTIKTYSTACPLFVPFIEEAEVNSPALKLIAEEYLKDMKKEGIDTLVMGCTHYPIIRGLIEDVIDHNSVKLIDPGQSQAESVAVFLKEKNLETEKQGIGIKTYFVTDLNPRFKSVAEMFLGDRIELLNKVELSDW